MESYRYATTGHFLPNTMAGFPPEVLAEICQHLKNDKDALKALRLVNRFLGVEASRYLYKTLLVYATPSSWEKLHSVAFCQHLTRYTEELEVATLEYLPVYADFEAWALATSKTRLIAQGSSSSLAGATAVMRDAGLYRSYCQWRHDELELLNRMTTAENGGDLSYWEQSVDGVTFPNLHTVKSLGARELWSWTPQGPTNKRERETAVLETMKPNTKTCKRMSAHLCMALQIFHVYGGLGVNIVSLELHRYREILAEQTFHVPALQTLRRLTLSFPSGPETKIESVMWGPVCTDMYCLCTLPPLARRTPLVKMISYSSICTIPETYHLNRYFISDILLTIASYSGNLPLGCVMLGN